MRAIVVREIPLLITTEQARITASSLQTVRVTPVREAQLTRRARLATIRIGRLPLTRVAHTTSGAHRLHRVLITPLLSAAILRRRNGLTLGLRGLIPHRNSGRTLRLRALI